VRKSRVEPACNYQNAKSQPASYSLGKATSSLFEGSVPVAHEPVIPLIAYRFPKAFAKHSKNLFV
jgi:hypothetical protein